MSDDNNTNVNDNNDVSGTNDKSNTKGDGTDSGKDNQEKTFTQKEVNAILKRAKLDTEKEIKVKLEKNLEGKTVLTDDDLEALKKEWRKEAEKDAALNNKRNEYKSRGLTDAQLAVIQVEKPEDFDAKVKELYGPLLKKEVPVLNSGKPKSDSEDNENKTLNDKLRAGLKRRKI